MVTTSADRTAQDGHRKPYMPRSVEEAVADVLLRLGAAVGLVALCMALLPAWGIALVVAYGYRLVARRVTYGWEWLPRLDIVALAGLGIVASWRIGLEPHGFLDVQRAAGAAFWVGATMPMGMPPDTLTGLLRDYAGTVWPYAAAWGPALGGGLLVASRFIAFNDGFSGENEGKEALHFEDLGRLAEGKQRAVAWAAPRVVGRGVLSLISAPPGGGKGYWIQGLVRAMQDGDTFYGLPTKRLGRVLWCTEEGPSVAETARRFGIKRGQVEILRHTATRRRTWPELVQEVRREAWRRKCAWVIFDTIGAWCPDAELTRAQANEHMGVARHELTDHGLACLFVHHDTKQGGKFGAGVSGHHALVGAVDILIELKRVSDDPKDARRRMVTSRRFGDMDVTARLERHRYVVEGTPMRPANPADAPSLADPDSPPPPEKYVPMVPVVKVPAHLRKTLDVLADRGVTVDAVASATKAEYTTARSRLKALEGLGLAACEGAGTKSAPLLWRRATGGPAPTSEPVQPGPTADPEYRRYLQSPEWVLKRAQILLRAGGRCERCGLMAPAEVHHLTYERVGDELPADLVAMCAACHRRTHATA